MIWIASYPRSGNTLLRTILRHCFNLKSASVYPNDLGGNKDIETYAGHIELDASNREKFMSGDIPLVKTHEYCNDTLPAIYVVRDGRAACVSLWAFYRYMIPLEAIVAGRHRFGSWAGHVLSWHPWSRSNTLLIKYEDMLSDLPAVLVCLSDFLNRDIQKNEIPDRKWIADKDGIWVRHKTSWADTLKGDLLEKFNADNQDMLEKMGYI